MSIETDIVLKSCAQATMSASGTQMQNQQVKALTGLRFFAALSIVLHHVQGEMWFPRLFDMSAGVGFFFVLSGFILQHTYRTRLFNIGFWRFLIMRVARIWPTHLAVLVLICISGGWLFIDFFWTHYSVQQLASVVFLLQSWNLSLKDVFILNAPSWSISTELLFYLVFPLYSPIAAKRPFGAIGIAAGMSIGWLLAMLWLHALAPSIDLSGALSVNPILRFFAFGLGIVGYEFFIVRESMRARLAQMGIGSEILVLFFMILMIIAGGFARELTGTPGVKELVQAFGFLAVIVVFFFQRGVTSYCLGSPAFVYLGEISYALYLGSRPKQGWYDSRAWSIAEAKPMETNLFWFNDEQWAKIVPHLPVNQPGPEREDDHRVLSGIMHVLKIGCRWEDCPKDYGPHKTIYNRFSRWSERGIWQKIFEAVAAPSEPPEQAALDSSHVKVHRCANGGKGGRIFRRSGLRKVARTARSTRSSMRRAALGHSS